MSWSLPIFQLAASAAPSLIGASKASGTSQDALKDIQAKRQAASVQLQNIMAQVYGQAVPIQQQAYNQDTALNKWGADTSSDLNNWAFTNALQAKGAGTNDAIASLQQGLSGAQSYLDPYVQQGSNAMASLARMVSNYGGGRGNAGNGTGAGAAFANAPKLVSPTFGQNAMVPIGSTPPPAVQFPDLSKTTGTGTGTGSPINFDAIQTAAGLTDSGANISDQIRNAEGSVKGHTGTATAITTALLGVAGLPFVGLVSKWLSLGTNKELASRGINAVSDYVWKDLYPQLEAGKMDSSQFSKLSNMALQDWANTLPENVKQKSVEDQLYWFQNSPNLPQGVNFEIPGYSATRHA